MLRTVWPWVETGLWVAGVGVGVVVVLMVVYIVYLGRANRPTTLANWAHSVRLEGKTILVTTTGTGVAVEGARLMAQMGARIILACSDHIKVQAAAGDVGEGGLAAVVSWRHLDTSSLASVNAFVDDILRRKEKLDVVVVAAYRGGGDDRKLTDEGLELTMATNHFGHFLMLNRLIGVLRHQGSGRVVVMAPSAQFMLSSINPKDLNLMRTRYGSLRVFAQSSLCNGFMSMCLADLTAGTGMTSNSFCPGLVCSVPYLCGSGVVPRLYRLLLQLVSRSDEEAAHTLVYLAGSSEVSAITGGFFVDCQEVSKSGLAGDIGLAKKVWEMSENLVGLAPLDPST